MTALSLRKLVADALADVGVSTGEFSPIREKPRETIWYSMESGFGMRRYASGRCVYIVQTRMSGRLRTVTIGPASLISRTVAASVAKRVIAHALVGNDPAEDRKRVRGAPAFDDFIAEYFAKCTPMWKASTSATHDIYRRTLIDGSFPDRFIDDIGTADIAKWFARATDSCGPGGANRCLDLLRMAFNKAEAWGYRLENTNPCTGQRRNRARRFERFLTPEQMAKVGAVLTADRDGPGRLKATFANAVLLLILTGCRHSEILNLRWTDVQGKRLKLRDSKTGPRTVWLGGVARALIAAMPRPSKVEWMFWNARNGKQIRAVGTYWHDVQARAGLSDCASTICATPSPATPSGGPRPFR